MRSCRLIVALEAFGDRTTILDFISLGESTNRLPPPFAVFGLMGSWFNSSVTGFGEAVVFLGGGGGGGLLLLVSSLPPFFEMEALLKLLDDVGLPTLAISQLEPFAESRVFHLENTFPKLEGLLGSLIVQITLI